MYHLSNGWHSADILSNVTNFSRKAMTEKCMAEKFYGFLLLNCDHFFDDTKPRVSVLHFSVIAFVQVNLMLSGSNKVFIVLPPIILPF